MIKFIKPAAAFILLAFSLSACVWVGHGGYDGHPYGGGGYGHPYGGGGYGGDHGPGPGPGYNHSSY